MITIKKLTEYLQTTLFIRSFIAITHVKKHEDEKIKRIIISYPRYQVELTLIYDCHRAYMTFMGCIDNHDVKEFLQLLDLINKIMVDNALKQYEESR